MTAGFYKLQDETLLFAPNYVEGNGYVLFSTELHEYELPIDGWYWFESEEQAKAFFEL